MYVYISMYVDKEEQKIHSKWFFFSVKGSENWSRVENREISYFALFFL